MTVPVFPARAGMSLTASAVTVSRLSFPRPRGDEPAAAWDAYTDARFSPPARG